VYSNKVNVENWGSLREGLFNFVMAWYSSS